MPIKYRKVSSGADLHPYMKKGFVFPKSDQPAPLTDSIEERREYLRTYKLFKRTFNLDYTRLFLLGIEEGLSSFSIKKSNILKNKEFINDVSPVVIEKLKNLEEEEIDFVHIGRQRWLAQTTFITKNT
jgi:hypothetical protein